MFNRDPKYCKENQHRNGEKPRVYSRLPVFGGVSQVYVVFFALGLLTDVFFQRSVAFINKSASPTGSVRIEEGLLALFFFLVIVSMS
jgi:hypothetical protein